MAVTDSDPRDLHGIAVDVQTDLQKLATGLAHAGAAPNAVQQLTKMAEIVSQVVKALGQGPVPAAGAGPQQPAQPGPAQPAGPQQPPQPQAPQGGPPQPGDVHGNLHSASQHLHAAMIASAQQRATQGR
jgi:hypothetical protein